MTAPAGKTPLNGRCGDCQHVWPVAWLPMPLADAACLMKAARCPLCAGAKVFVAGPAGEKPA